MAKELLINKFKNGFGIKKLSVNNNGSKLLNNVIYAPNGVFKSSFAKSFYNISVNEKVEERIKHLQFDYEIFYNNQPINDVKDNILVFSRDIMSNNYHLSGNMNLQINHMALIPILQSRIQRVFEQMNEKYNVIINILNAEGVPTNYHKLILGVSNMDDHHNVITAFKHLLIHTEFIDNDNLIADDVLFSKGYDKLDTEDFRGAVKDYYEYVVEMAKNVFFDDKFSVFAAKDFLKAVKKANFLNENRLIIIDGVTYNNINDLESLIDSKIKDIIDLDETVEKIKKIQSLIPKQTKIDKQIAQLINTNIDAVELMTIPREFIKMSQIRRKYEHMYDEIEEFLYIINKELDDIELEASKTESQFDKAINIFKQRFSPKFDIEIENRNIVALGIDFVYPIIKFVHNSQNDIKLDENILFDILSSGEKNTLNILKFIVLYEQKKQNNPLIILDDIIETFDYGNRYAFIEYIKDIINDGSNVIILTSNYEFFKNISLRVKGISYLGAIEKDGNVTIQKYAQLKIEKLGIKKLNHIENLYYLMPFAREIASYKNKDNEFLKYFHYKKGTSNLKNKKLCSLVLKYCDLESNLNLIDLEKKYVDTLFDYCDFIINNGNAMTPFDLKNKIIISFGIRLRFEKIIIDKFGYNILNNIDSNQTAYLIKQYNNIMTDNFKKICNRLIICIPEFIHLNAFMYEPLVDIMPETLIKLYKDLLHYSKNEIKWNV